MCGKRGLVDMSIPLFCFILVYLFARYYIDSVFLSIIIIITFLVCNP